MQGKPGRNLPEWYRQSVDLAAEVFSGAPQAVNLSMPKIVTRDSGAGIAAQRQGSMTNKQPRLGTEGTLGTKVDGGVTTPPDPVNPTSGTAGYPRRNGLRPPPSPTPLWAPPEVDADTPDKRKPHTQPTEVDNGR